MNNTIDKCPPNVQFKTLIESLDKLISFNGTRLESDLEMIFCGYQRSQIPEEISGSDRERLLLTFLKLKDVCQLAKTVETNPLKSFDYMNCMGFLMDRGLYPEFMKYCEAKD